MVFAWYGIDKLLKKNSSQDVNGELVGSTWVWKETQMNNDDVIIPRRTEAFTLMFDSEGRVLGTTDCNNFSGTYSLGSDGDITFGQIASTLMFCEGSQETEFTSAVLESNRVFFAENGNLVLLLPVDSGSIIFEKK